MRTLLFALLLALPAAASAQLAPGDALPEATASFSSVLGESYRLADIQGEKGLVLVMWGADCPWVTRYEDRLLTLVRDYGAKGFGFALVDPTPDADAEAQRDQAGRYGDLPYLADSDARLARALGATRQPEVFVFDASGTLSYRGALDDSASDPTLIENDYARDVLDALGNDQPVSTMEAAAFGCTLKL